MYPKQHLFLGLAFSLILFLLYPKIGLTGFFLIFLSSVLIDIDHYVYYVVKKKDFSLKNAYLWFINIDKKMAKMTKKQRNNFYIALCFLHGFELLIILFLLANISELFFFIFIGFSFHLLLDIAHQVNYKERLDKVSLINDFFRFKKLKSAEEI